MEIMLAIVRKTMDSLCMVKTAGSSEKAYILPNGQLLVGEAIDCLSFVTGQGTAMLSDEREILEIEVSRIAVRGANEPRNYAFIEEVEDCKLYELDN